MFLPYSIVLKKISIKSQFFACIFFFSSVTRKSYSAQNKRILVVYGLLNCINSINFTKFNARTAVKKLLNYAFILPCFIFNKKFHTKKQATDRRFKRRFLVPKNFDSLNIFFISNTPLLNHSYIQLFPIHNVLRIICCSGLA